MDSIHWAAFYGDCEHEVLEVTSGYRITLTYNLYYSSISLSASLVADTRNFPLYRIAGDALREADFMPRGKSFNTSFLSSDTDLANRRYPRLLLPSSVCTFPRKKPEVVARGFQGRRSRRSRLSFPSIFYILWSIPRALRHVSILELQEGTLTPKSYSTVFFALLDSR